MRGVGGYATLCLMPPIDLITTAQAAEILRVSIATINRDVSLGRLPAHQKLPGRTGAYLFDRKVIEEAAAVRAARVSDAIAGRSA